MEVSPALLLVVVVGVVFVQSFCGHVHTYSRFQYDTYENNIKH